MQEAINSPKLRREGVRYFLLWYQALGDNAPQYVHNMYGDLIPGLIVPQKGVAIGPDTEFSATDFLNHPNMKVEGSIASVQHDAYSHPVQSSELAPLLPPSSNEKSAPPDPRDGLEVLLNCMVQTSLSLRWRDNRAQKDHKTFAFLLERFKHIFLPVFCPNFDFTMSVYEPRLELPQMRNINKKDELMASCIVVLVNWLSRFTLERTLHHRLENMQLLDDNMDQQRLLSYQQTLIVREVLYTTRDNVNFVHEVYRQAFLLNFTSKPQIEAIRTAIAVYRDWMTGNTPPPFLLEPEQIAQIGPQQLQLNSNNINANAGGTPRATPRLRNPSYVGAIAKENLLIRAGLQNMLQVFVTNAANVFLVNTGHLNIYFPTKSRDYRSTPLNEQTEICKKVLNVYRTMVMNTRMEARTWEQLLLILLQVTGTVLHQQSPTHNGSGGKTSNLGGILGQAIFQTLIVTWIRAHTNVPVNVQLWEKFLTVLTSLTYREELIIEWDKTIQTLTRVFSRYVYALNLQDLPLDRLAESKGKRRRFGSVWQQNGNSVVGANVNVVGDNKPFSNALERERESNSSRTDEHGTNAAIVATHASTNNSNNNNSKHVKNQLSVPSRISLPQTPFLNRSYSEGSLTSMARNSRMKRTQQKHKAANTTDVNHVSALPAELNLSAEALQGTTTNDNAKHELVMKQRRALSLDSLSTFGCGSGQTARQQRQQRQRKRRNSLVAVDGEEEFEDDDELDGLCVEGSRTPSPTASSGLDGSNFIKDTHMQIDVLTSSLDDQHSSYNSQNSTERRSIILGGTATGWLPDSTAIMWKRMLGALGDVNRIPKPELHAQVFKHLYEMTHNLIKIKQNQGISSDNQSTPPPPNLVPPIGIVVPWCYGALQLDRSFKKGKLYAIQILCTLALHGVLSNMQNLPIFYHTVHQLLTGEDHDLIYAILQHLQGPRFLSLLLPAHTMLMLDIVNASAILLTSLEVNRNTPRAEVAALLGSLLCYPPTLLPKPMLQPTPQLYELIECADLQDHILNILLRCARREPSSKARCIAISQLGQWILLQLSQPAVNGHVTNVSAAAGEGFQQAVPHPKGVKPQRPSYKFNSRIKEAIQVLLQALQFKHRTIAMVAVDALKLCAERGQQLASIERMPQIIISAICKALEIQQVSTPKDTDKIVLNSLMLCLGEYCMAFPLSVLLKTLNERGDTLLLQVLRVLLQIATGAPKHERVKLTADDDFDVHITNDDLMQDGKLPEANYQTSETIQNCISAIKLCAKAVTMHLVTHLGHFPMGIGAARLSSLVEEQDDVQTPSLGALPQQQSSMELLRRDSVELPSILHAQNLQLFMLNTGLVASFIELPALQLPGGGATAGLVTAEKQVRVLLRDLNGKACWDASILYSEPTKKKDKNANQHVEVGSGDGANRTTNYFNTLRHNNSSNLDSLLTSMVGLHVTPPRHTLRHRPEGELPLAKDIAPDLDQLDDVGLKNIGVVTNI